MNELVDLIEDYLRLRRSLGFKLAREERYLNQYAAYLARIGAAVTVDSAVAWATSPNGHPRYHASRLVAVRQFTRWARTFDPGIEVPPARVLRTGPLRAVPYIYTGAQILALLEQASRIRTAMVAATYRTLIGLVASTGLRIGEAISADRSDLRDGVLTIRDTKFNKTRLVPLHPTVLDELAAYQGVRDRLLGPVETDALFVSTAGTRVNYKNFHFRFHRLVEDAGITARSSRCRPRIHDLRHTFAVDTMRDAYRRGMDPKEILPVLSTYLGHRSASSTYWYLQAEPGLLAEAAARLKPFETDDGETELP